MGSVLKFMSACTAISIKTAECIQIQLGILEGIIIAHKNFSNSELISLKQIVFVVNFIMSQM